MKEKEPYPNKDMAPLYSVWTDSVLSVCLSGGILSDVISHVNRLLHTLFQDNSTII